MKSPLGEKAGDNYFQKSLITRITKKRRYLSVDFNFPALTPVT